HHARGARDDGVGDLRGAGAGRVHVRVPVSGPLQCDVGNPESAAVSRARARRSCAVSPSSVRLPSVPLRRTLALGVTLGAVSLTTALVLAQRAPSAPGASTVAPRFGTWGVDLTGMDRSVRPGDD